MNVDHEDALLDALARARLALASAGTDDPRARLLEVALDAVTQLGGLSPEEAARRAERAVTALLGALLSPDERGSDTSPIPRKRAVDPPTERTLLPPPPATDRHREPPTERHRQPGPRPSGPTARLDATPVRASARPGPGPMPRGDATPARASARPARPGEATPPTLVPQARPREASAPPGGGQRQHPLQVGVGALARDWQRLGGDPEAGRALESLSTADVAQQDGARFHVALLRALDRARAAARHLPCEREVRARTELLVHGAIAGAVALGVRVASGAPDDHDGCPVTRRLAWGEPAGAVIDVEQHGVLFADGRAEPAVVLVGAGPAPPWHAPLCDGLALAARHGGSVPDGDELVRSLRGWIDELPGTTDPERRQTTLRFAATALFQTAAVVPAAHAPFAALAHALEAGGSYLIPLEPGALSDARRYELVLRPGAGVPRLLRPGFVGAGNVVQQRARVLADPGWLSSAGA